MCDLLAGLPIGALQTLADQVARRSFRAGEIVCVAGSEGNERLSRAFGTVRARSGSGEIVGEIGRGELVGEMSLLTGESAERHGRARARHRHGRADRVGVRPGAGRVSRLLSDGEPPTGGPAAPGAGTIGARAGEQWCCCCSTMVGPDLGLRSTPLSRCGEPGGRCPRGWEGQGPDLAALETSHDIVLIISGPDGMTTVPWVAGQSDRTLLFVDAESQSRGDSLHRRSARPVDLVLVHPDSVTCPLGTRRLARRHRPRAHHHVNESNSATSADWIGGSEGARRYW